MPAQKDTRDVAFARSPIGGKKTAEVKYRCADELKFELQRRAHALGMSESELSELFTAIGLFGVDHVRMVQDQRLAIVAKMFPGVGHADE
jgi:hypothetical protein